MFFSWYARNRHFKPKSNWPGQIFPVLLICLVGLLAAVGVTIGVGESAKTKTLASNAADAGSLAAASSWAGAFNKLVARNKELETYTAGNFGYYMTPKDTYQYYKEMKDYYLEMRGYYTILYNLAAGYLEEALDYSQEAERLARLALEQIKIVGADCTTWDNQGKPGLTNTGADYNIKAAEQALESAKCIGAFFILTQYMQRITDFFKANQTQNFCEAKDFMDRAYDTSRQKGLSYAFSNSGTSGDDFNYWLGTGTFYNPLSNSATYQWPVGTRPNGAPKYCGISVTLDLPKILSYALKHTKWNYPQKKTLNVVAIPCIPVAAATIKDDPFNIQASVKLTNIMLQIVDFLNANAAAGLAIYNKTVAGKACCDANHHRCIDWYTCPVPPTPGCGGCKNEVDDCPDAVGRFFDPARTDQAALINYQNCVIDGLAAINTLSGNDLTIPKLEQLNLLIYDNVWAQKAGVESVRTCEDVQTYPDASGYPGMMIINIDEVILTSAWTTQCTVLIFCQDDQGVPQGTTRTSTSRFDGGDIGKFKDEYYPEIINAS